MMIEDPWDALHRVTDEATFIAFLDVLAKDRAMQDDGTARGWENGTIEGFLEAAVACATAHLDKESREGDDNPWKACAKILYCGKIYE